jgi:hypothetical protein
MPKNKVGNNNRCYMILEGWSLSIRIVLIEGRSLEEG